MIANRWTEDLRRHHEVAQTELDRRAISVCEAWITWADAFGIAPPAEQVQRLVNADPASAGVIVRQITLKLAVTCPIQMPMIVPTDLISLLDGAAEVAPLSQHMNSEISPRPNP